MPPDTEKNQEAAQRHVEEARRVAEVVRAACIEAALRGYEDAQISGLCREGAWECAVDAMRMLDVEQFVRPPTE